MSAPETSAAPECFRAVVDLGLIAVVAGPAPHTPLPGAGELQWVARVKRRGEWVAAYGVYALPSGALTVTDGRHALIVPPQGTTAATQASAWAAAVGLAVVHHGYEPRRQVGEA